MRGLARIEAAHINASQAPGPVVAAVLVTQARGQLNVCASKGTGAMDLVDLRYLSIAVETGSFSSAAQSLGVEPSTISRRIVRLEDELGVTIFERGAFGIRLTAAGPQVMVKDW